MRSTAVLAFLLGLAAVVHAQIVIDSARFGYTGTITRYSSVDDAIDGHAALGTYSVPQRDLGISVIVDAAWHSRNTNYVGTLWNFISDVDGRTPSNTNYGFVQLGDLDASTITALAASWNAGLDTYSLHLTGAGATAQNDYARLWNAGGSAGQAAITVGSFINYDLSLVAGGLTASWDTAHGSYDSIQQEPTSIAGSFTGIFQNTSPNDGYAYTFDLSLNLESWAYEHRNALANGSDPYVASTFATSTVIPEPSTTALFLGLSAIGFAIWRRRRC